MERVSSLLISKGLFNKLLRPRRKTLEVARNLDNNARFDDNYQSPLIVSSSTPPLSFSLPLLEELSVRENIQYAKGEGTKTVGKAARLRKAVYF